MQPSFRNIVAITCGLGLATRRPGFIVKRLRSRWRRGQLLAVLETTISACAATAGFNEETVDRSYFSDAEIGDRAGKAVICGAYAIDELDDTASRRVLDMLREGAVRVGHTTLARDLTFFRNEGSANSQRSLIGKPANCSVTSKVWRREFTASAPRLAFPS